MRSMMRTLRPQVCAARQHYPVLGARWACSLDPEGGIAGVRVRAFTQSCARSSRLAQWMRCVWMSGDQTRARRGSGSIAVTHPALPSRSRSVVGFSGLSGKTEAPSQAAPPAARDDGRSR